MEHREPYITKTPEYHAAGLSLVAAELEIARLLEQLEQVRQQRDAAILALMLLQNLYRERETGWTISCNS